MVTWPQVRDAVRGMLANVQAVFRPKAADVSEQRRLEGERALLGSNARGALTTLSQAVMRAPAAAGPEPLLALALWARSDALLQLRHFQHSLDDVQLSLKSGLPEDKRYATAEWQGFRMKSHPSISSLVAEVLVV